MAEHLGSAYNRYGVTADEVAFVQTQKALTGVIRSVLSAFGLTLLFEFADTLAQTPSFALRDRLTHLLLQGC